MADFAIYGEAIAGSMNYNSLVFVNAYYNMIGKQNIDAIKADPGAQAVLMLVDEFEQDEKKNGLD